MARALPEVRPETALDGVEVVDFHHAPPAFTHEGEPAVEIEHLDAVLGGDQYAAQELRLGATLFVGATLFGAVAKYLDEALCCAGRVAERHHLAAGPEARAVLAHVPALVAGAALLQGGSHLGLRYAVLAVRKGEEHARGLAEHFRFGPAESALGAAVPLGYPPVQAERDDGVVNRAVQDHALAAVGRPRSLFGGCKLLPQVLQLGRERRLA